uniref:Phospholipid phosphatase related 3 n=1 Tax=Cairina moschata TaxID=8855 RepID=A0A8C3BPC8_CAIMO
VWGGRGAAAGGLRPRHPRPTWVGAAHPRGCSVHGPAPGWCLLGTPGTQRGALEAGVGEDPPPTPPALPAAHRGLLHRDAVLPGADRPLQAGQGGLPVLRPRALHALRGDQRGAHPAAHAAQPGLRRPCCLDHGWGGHRVLPAVQAEGTRRCRGQHQRRRLQLQLLPAQDRKVCGCPRVRALCHCPGDGRDPAGHRLPRALLPDRLQAQLHAAGHPLRRQPLHHPGHLLGHGQARHPVRQEDVPVPARDAVGVRSRLRLDVFQLHHLGQHQAPQAHPGLRLRHRRWHLRPDADHAVPQPPRRRLRGLPDRLGHRRLPGGCRRARGLRAACPGPADPALSPPQAYHAVGNFRAPTERAPAPAPAKDALRALTQRGHDSVYHQNKSVSTDELNPQTRLEEAARPVPREKNSLGSLKRASVDVDLLAPRSPMGKENMVTFSNTLPRVNTPSMDDPARRHMTIHVPVDASRSKQLITEWKQKSLEGRSMTLAEEAGALGRGTGDADEDVPPSLYPTVQARPAERAAMGPRVLIQPRPGASQLVHIPEESQAGAGGAAGGGAAVRAKWVMVAEKGGAQRVANPPRLMQVIAMSKQQSMVSVTPKHSETSSSSTSSDSSQYRSPSERDSSSIITIDAHAPHHPVVHLSAGNGPWEWKSAQKGPEGPDAYELGEMGKDFRGFRPAKSAGVSPGSSVSDIEQDEPRYGSLATINMAAGGSGERGDGPPEGLLGTASRESTLRRKPAEKDGHTDSEADNYYRKMQASRRFKD